MKCLALISSVGLFYTSDVETHLALFIQFKDSQELDVLLTSLIEFYNTNWGPMDASVSTKGFCPTRVIGLFTQIHVRMDCGPYQRPTAWVISITNSRHRAVVKLKYSINEATKLILHLKLCSCNIHLPIPAPVQQYNDNQGTI